MTHQQIKAMALAVKNEFIDALGESDFSVFVDDALENFQIVDVETFGEDLERQGWFEIDTVALLMDGQTLGATLKLPDDAVPEVLLTRILVGLCDLT
ncbi:MAG: hypothetical protein IJO40_12600 [Thermoguttaceae bacterium]|nr:hypothetical protein [Thermoguttaceae bacterium]